MSVQLMLGDCLERMKEIPDASVDLVLCDLPYGTTQNKWDVVIPFEPLWVHYRRVCKGRVVLTASQPFTSLVVASNLHEFKHAWVWEKSEATGHLNAKIMPMKLHEDILVFREGNYFPQGLIPFNKMHAGRGNNASGSNFGKSSALPNFQEWTNYPRSIIRFKQDGRVFHPTQKPLNLMDYLIRTYTNEGDTVLDNCMGSGSTGLACAEIGRNFIGIEKDPDIFKTAQAKIGSAQHSLF